MTRILCMVLLVLVAFNNYAWNALGHQLIAQIAYDNLTPEARELCDQYNRSLDSSPSLNFVSAAVWLDQIRKNDIHWFDNLHYIDLPFSRDQTKLPPIQDVNALWGIKQAISVLSSQKASLADKGLSLRILTHLVGDIHQPLHTATKISKRLPKGDLGGNLYQLGKNPIGKNLHQYWDNGAGILIGQSKKFQVRNKASQLEKKWPCKQANAKKQPRQWINESHKLALAQVYTVSSHRVPSKKYQLNAQNITQKQILFAGCRLAGLLNSIAKQQKYGA
ncbi:S1/P1 nuclease [Legionella maioricensis]|uniref:S1/P1 nuclease n=1 Tax=Legionella maioricensis TaxID=2896528 RepID=A0A9X2D3G9_9GAMM|nr:S1/P1 nuclease [Legionella maioricensis]MCL9685562.1 S1/P1 nuclease [Legionella maioricensis]MCL9688935.1 S1/P1 nuclease [Legionella maioricensis]